MRTSVFLVVSCCIFCVQASYDVCWMGDSDCHSCPSGEGKEDWTSHLWLSKYPEIKIPAAVAEKLIQELDQEHVIRVDSLDLLHTSVQYMCCHTLTEKLKLYEAFHKYEWQPFNVTYYGYTCNVDHKGSPIYITMKMDKDSEPRMLSFVRSLEAVMENAGVHVHHPRDQGFHCTMARVTPEYPVDLAIAKLNTTIPKIGTITVDHFEFGGVTYNAKK